MATLSALEVGGQLAPDGAAEPSAPTEPTCPAGLAKTLSSKERLRLNLYAALFAADLLALAGAFLGANWLRFASFLDGPGLGLALACAPVYATLAFSGRSYALEVLTSPRRGIKNSLRSLAMTACVLLAVIYSAKEAEGISRIVFALGIGGAALLMVGLRSALGHAAGRRYNWTFLNEVLLVDGVPMLPTRGQIVLFADDLRLTPSINDPDSFDRMGRLLLHCDRVTLACHPSRRAAWAGVLKCAGIAVELLTPELDSLGPLQLRQFGGSSAVLVATGPLALRDRLLKRSLDLIIALGGLCLLAPVMLCVAIAISIESRGPIFFRQERVGLGNRIFPVLKFRTMRSDASDREGSRSATRGDDRVTQVGRFLRRSSLDELPQLLNVLTNDMSLVGPRPHALGSTAGEALFWDADNRYWERGMVKPGITGLAQVRGLRGATDTREDLINRVQADLEYLSGWTIWRDVGILARTVRVLVHNKAY